MRPLYLLGVALTLSACGGSGQNVEPSRQIAQSSDRVRFVVFGDAGTGSERQLAVGEAMATVCESRGCDFAIELGDNFYPSGVNSANDSQFETKFEIPYEKLNFPIYVTLGNHDNSTANGDGADNSKGDYQVEYHYRKDRKTNKFRMPARYYSFTTPARSNPPLVEFFSLDSNPLAATFADPDPAWNPTEYSQVQLSWLNNALRRSDAHWKIAFAHHPYVSNGEGGNAGDYQGVPALAANTASGQLWREFLESSICTGGVDLFLQGHDHDLAWIKPVENCGKTHFVVSGAADERGLVSHAPRNESYWYNSTQLGFFWFEIQRDVMTGAGYVLNGLSLPETGGEPVAAFEQTVTKPN